MAFSDAVIAALNAAKSSNINEAADIFHYVKTQVQSAYAGQVGAVASLSDLVSQVTNLPLDLANWLGPIMEEKLTAPPGLPRASMPPALSVPDYIRPRPTFREEDFYGSTKTTVARTRHMTPDDANYKVSKVSEDNLTDRITRSQRGTDKTEVLIVVNAGYYWAPISTMGRSQHLYVDLRNIPNVPEVGGEIAYCTPTMLYTDVVRRARDAGVYDIVGIAEYVRALTAKGGILGNLPVGAVELWDEDKEPSIHVKASQMFYDVRDEDVRAWLKGLPYEMVLPALPNIPDNRSARKAVQLAAPPGTFTRRTITYSYDGQAVADPETYAQTLGPEHRLVQYLQDETTQPMRFALVEAFFSLKISAEDVRTGGGIKAKVLAWLAELTPENEQGPLELLLLTLHDCPEPAHALFDILRQNTCIKRGEGKYVFAHEASAQAIMQYSKMVLQGQARTLSSGAVATALSALLFWVAQTQIPKVPGFAAVRLLSFSPLDLGFDLGGAVAAVPAGVAQESLSAQAMWMATLEKAVATRFPGVTLKRSALTGLFDLLNQPKVYRVLSSGYGLTASFLFSLFDAWNPWEGFRDRRPDEVETDGALGTYWLSFLLLAVMCMQFTHRKMAARRTEDPVNSIAWYKRAWNIITCPLHALGCSRHGRGDAPDLRETSVVWDGVPGKYFPVDSQPPSADTTPARGPSGTGAPQPQLSAVAAALAARGDRGKLPGSYGSVNAV